MWVLLWLVIMLHTFSKKSIYKEFVDKIVAIITTIFLATNLEWYFSVSTFISL